MKKHHFFLKNKMHIAFTLYTVALTLTIMSGAHVCPDELALSLQMMQCTCEFCALRANILLILQMKK